MTDASPVAPESTDRPVRIEGGNELDRLLDEHDRVLVDFYTKGCTLCQSIEPVLGNVARATDAVVAMLNPQTDLELVEEYDVRSVPTLVLFEDGREVGRRAEGFIGAETLVEFVRSSGESEQ